MKNLLIAISTIFVISTIAGVAHASADAVTSCLNPTGTVKASYASGDHGIAGSVDLKNGSDTVYTLDSNNLMQCFCGIDGNGIQTNWKRASDLTQDQIKVFQSQGWIYIPNGTAWGLDDAPYLAQNSNYSCGSNGTGSSNNSNNNSSNNSSSSSSSNTVAVAGASAVLGLASTGNVIFIIGVFAAGILAFATGIILKRSK